MNRALALLIGAGLAVAAILITVFAPTEEQQMAPFVRVIPALETGIASREFELTVHGVRIAERLQTPEWVGETEGIWIVADIEFSGRIDMTGIDGLLRIGDRDYLASARPEYAAIDEGAMSEPGLPWAGSMVFEIPASALGAPAAHAAVIQFATGDTRLDGVLEYTVDLAGIEREDSITVIEPERVAP